MDPENLENLDVDSEEDLRNDAMYDIMLDKWQRWVAGGILAALWQFLMVVFSTRELDFYKNFHDKKHLHYTSTCGHKHKSVSLTFNRQSVSVIMYPGVFFALVFIFVFVSLSCSKSISEKILAWIMIGLTMEW